MAITHLARLNEGICHLIKVIVLLRRKEKKGNDNSLRAKHFTKLHDTEPLLVYVLFQLIHQRAHLSFILFHTGLYIAVKYFELDSTQITADQNCNISAF